MKEITHHHIPGVPATVRVFPEDEPAGINDAPHHYRLTIGQPGQETQGAQHLRFQKGNFAEQANGITNEALLAVVIDRLQVWQKGLFSCRENAIALTHLETALLWLQKRTIERTARGVQGTQKV